MKGDAEASPLPAEVAAGLAEVASGFAHEVGGPITLAELLEVLGWAVPANSEATDGTFPQPLTYQVTLAGGRPYAGGRPSRVPELNDAVFVDAGEWQTALAERLSAVSGVPVTPQRFAEALLRVLRSGCVPLADVQGADLGGLTAEVPEKRIPRPRPGDVLAIPAREGGHHLALVLTRNRFGTALGLFEGRSPYGRLGPDLRARSRRHPVYTEESQIKNGTWAVVGHDESLLALFPADPPIYHRPDAWPGIVDTGEFGAAETADGSLRFIDADEAREVGLQDGTYRSTHVASFLQKVLDDGGVSRS
ncbi:hypothetical protein [Actinoallomurus iriomotensis]|uniref:Uncharacterized protein n=1 Tax=Actinoallomurus iriomotensis TaxID=478107 RepID=A0A9W6VNJ0_9ACTN|nr:hypothetical protein [Actinoallomurus iriomotensis]GLY78818.1 hypothetical protein Airi01_070850 [Actinoallomurus iriomotensis]